MVTLSGRCFCGAVKWSYDGEVTRNLICHCIDCQRATSSPFTAFTGLRPAQLTWAGDPNHYESSPGSKRGFCATCGTRLYFQSEKWPGEIHIHAATLDNPTAYQPDRHVCLASSPDWVKIGGDLPGSNGFSEHPQEIRDRTEC